MTNEHQLYRDNIISWVFYLATKYLKAPRFKPVLDLYKSVLTKDELEAARIMWTEENRPNESGGIG